VEPLTEREGVAGIALLAMFADGLLRAEEDEVLRERLAAHPLFAGVSDEQLGVMLARLERLSRTDGPELLLRACCAVAREGQAESALRLATEIVEADGELAPEETAYVRRVRQMLTP
jgi:tellurite resistance protein